MEKQYVKGCKIVKKEFDNGGSVLNCYFKLDDIQEMSENGWVNLTIAKRREPSDNGATHYAYKNEFKPKNFDEKLQKEDEILPF